MQQSHYTTESIRKQFCKLIISIIFIWKEKIISAQNMHMYIRSANQSGLPPWQYPGLTFQTMGWFCQLTSSTSQCHHSSPKLVLSLVEKCPDWTMMMSARSVSLEGFDSPTPLWSAELGNVRTNLPGLEQAKLLTSYLYQETGGKRT